MGDAELLPRDRSVQACSFIVRLAGVAPSIVQGFAPLQLTIQGAGAVRASQLPPGCESVLVRPAAGRCVSATQQALGALRVLGTSMAMGQAIGIAAGLAAEGRVSLRAIRAEEVQERIRNSGTGDAV